MLVLSRKHGETLVFPGTATTIQVVAIKAGQVRLGVDAPPDVEVWRGELTGTLPTARPAAARRGGWDDIERLLDKRLAIAERGLGVLRGQLTGGEAEDALLTLGEVGAEMALLRDRIRFEADAARRSAARDRGHKPKALLVEDNPQERELLAVFLRHEGLDVDTAADGTDALDYLHARGRPDLLLLDMGLPRLSGPATVQHIRRDPACAGLKIFAVSGHAASEFDLASGPAGVDYWFQKPVDPGTLFRDLSRELARP